MIALLRLAQRLGDDVDAVGIRAGGEPRIEVGVRPFLDVVPGLAVALPELDHAVARLAQRHEPLVADFGGREERAWLDAAAGAGLVGAGEAFLPLFECLFGIDEVAEDGRRLSAIL